MRRDRFIVLGALAAATMLIAASLIEPVAMGPTTAPVSGHPEPSPAIEHLAQAISTCDLARAETLLEEQSDSFSSPATGPTFPADALILGLAAQSCGHFSASLEWLRVAPADGAHSDWRLYGLALSAIELGQYPAASAALGRLRAEHSSSPLFGKALLTASSLAEQRGDLASVAEIARQGRHWQLESEASETLEVAAWQAGSILDDDAIRRAAAIQLLTEHPLRASELGVIEGFRLPDGNIPWLQFLTADQIVQRAEKLQEAGLEESAMSTLADVPETARGWRWHLVSAEALTASGRGEESLVLLEGMPARNRLQASEYEWQQAMAALEVSAPRSGRDLNSAQRQMMRNRAHRHLETAIARGLDSERTRRAFRILFEDALKDDLFEQALETLRRLKAFDPEDESGAGQLWRLGWKQHNEHNYSGAIGYWAELSSLYPTSTYNRSGLYWAARSHDALGNHARSRQLLIEVADVPFTDFYRRHALRRLEDEVIGNDDLQTPTAPWPFDPILSRAELLSSLGLYQAALVELEVLSQHAEPRSTRALKALVLAAVGQPRKSIIEIKSVFPLLGTAFQGMAPERATFLYYPTAFEDLIEQHSDRNGLDRNLVFAMIRQESAFDPGARSRAGARGLMQVMPATGREIARRLGLKYTQERWSDPAFSIQLGTTYYKQVRSMFDGDEELSLAGYNAGPFRIKRLWRQAGAKAELDRFLETLQLRETKSYVKRVLLFADSYNRLYPRPG